MDYLRRVGWLSSLAVLLATGCTIAPPPGSPVPPAAELLPGDGRAFAYGQTMNEVLRNPDIAGKVRDLFGADWAPASQAGGQLALGADAYFGGNAPLRMVRIGGADYIALAGCVPNACNTHRVLLLVREGGSELLARLDEGGFAHYYGYGRGDVTRNTVPNVVDSGLRALRRGGNPYPGMS
jgi:hypothetical protein